MSFYKKGLYIISFFIISAAVFADTSAVFQDEYPSRETSQSNDTTIKFPIKQAQYETFEDLGKKYPMDAPNPDNVKTIVEYDPNTGNYILRTYVGNVEIAAPFTMTEQEYRDYSARQAMQRYWRERNSQSMASNEDKFSVTDMKFDIGPADKVFGPGGVQVRTQGSAELSFGLRTNNVQNPALTERQRKNTTFDFQEKMQLNVNGKVGNRVTFGLNYNTEASFDTDQKLISLKYQPSPVGGGEDDIIRSIETGNVSMQSNNSLISGSTSLFGIKTELQFGKLNVTALASQQKSESQTVSSKGGVQTSTFDIGAHEYDENRHFFLGHYFRDTYETSISKLPYISSGIKIERIEVWITNKRGSYDQARNILAFMDLAERDSINNPHWATTGNNKYPYNKVNPLYQEIIGLPDVRKIQLANDILNNALSGEGIVGGEDYEKIELARLLSSSEYTLNADLGYISLRSALNPDEALAVAFEYTYRGTAYQVGEFSTDASITAPDALVVKLLKGTAQSPELKNWDLMMKNVYSIGASSIQQNDFELNIVYRNDSIGTDLRYITEGKIQNRLLLRVMSLDRLNSKQAVAPDGIFDYVEGYTVLSSTGRIIFPVLEPFGSLLKDSIANDAIAEKYIYQELYDSTLVVAQEFSEKNKFRLVGKYRGASSSGSEISLNAMNVSRGSVTVTAGGVTLIENVDYTVDYTMGMVRIINQSLLDSSTQIDVQLESQSMFTMQRKTLLGTHLEYQFNKDFSLGGTVMHLSEKPLTTKVNTGNEPISNTIWGMNTSWRKESQLITNLLDKLPFVNATQPSSIALNAEFAQLIPGHSDVVGSAGLAYIDDFEATKTNINIHYPYYWKLSSTPSQFPESTNSNDISYGFNRSLLAWYYVDPVLNANRSETPVHLRNNLESQSNHLTRNVSVHEVFPNRELSTTELSLLTVLNLSFYPRERGPYNLNVADMQPDGYLSNPKEKWGGMMRKLDQTDFETANIEYIEFWMMDPFINDTSKTHTGGQLYFNLGDISEDVLKDGKKFFEHGLDVNGDMTKGEETVWGIVPKTQSTVSAFDNTEGARKNQDVGLNGLSTAQEFEFSTYKNYVEQVKSIVTDPDAIERMTADKFSPFNDPSGDNYHYYRGSDYDARELDILSRYKYYNGTEGNSPDVNETIESYSTSATTMPDIEDLNGDNTLNEYERYYSYRVSITPDSMEIGRNKYITDQITSTVNLKNGKTEEVTWYQFRIPVRNPDDAGTLRNIKSIRFIRMYLTGFEEEIHLRFATLDLVRGEWRSYTKPLFTEASTGTLEVQAVNVEENSGKTPVNYILPPGVSRQTDPSQPQLLQQNEESMLLRVKNLSSREAKAVYKNVSYDMRQYKRLQMFVHAEKLIDDNTDLKDNELTAFIRIGSDMVNNYYEYEISLKLTPHGIYSSLSSSDRQVVWPESNMFDFAFTSLTKAKLKRNSDPTHTNILSPYVTSDEEKTGNQITVVGNPSISEVNNIMIGIRNMSGNVKSGEIWVNELRMSEFDEDGGWAAMANLAIGLSDIGTVNFAGRTETAGFGSIDSNVQTRNMDDLYQMNFSTSMDLGRFLPEKAKLQIPAYFSYTNETLSPKYNPLDQDILLDDALEILETQSEKDSLKNLSQTVATSKSFNISNARVNIKSKTPQFYDPANVSFNVSQSETNERSPEIEKNLIKTQRASINYAFSFNSQPWEPFKDVKALNNPMFKIIKEINLYYLPSSISFNTDINRQFSQVVLREFEKTNLEPTELSFSKDFMWNRQFNIEYNLTKALRLSLNTAMNSNIEEPYFTPEIGKEYYEQWRDTVWANIKKLGTPYAYQQVFNASWTLPINKIPFLEWTNIRASYTSNYNWNLGAQVEDVEVGNEVTSLRNWQLDGSFNMETLYNKSKYLQDVNRRYSSRTSSNQRAFQPRTFNQTVNIKRGEPLSLDHRLGSTSLNVTAVDKSGNPVRISTKTTNNNAIAISSSADLDSVVVTVATKDPNVRTMGEKVTDFTVRTLMFVRNFSANYRESSSLLLPGFLSTPGFMGQDGSSGLYSPGYAFAFGLHDDDMIDQAIANNWLVMDTLVLNPAVSAKTSDLTLKAALEPIAGLKIDLEAKRYTASNMSVRYMIDGRPSTYSGSYNMTIMAISTAFKPVGDVNSNYNSELFNRFLDNRAIMSNRLNTQLINKVNESGGNYPNQGFFTENGLGGQEFDPEKSSYADNAADVLIPSFIAAYTGKDVTKMETSPFLSLLSMLPNWRVNYDGLTRIPFLKRHFKSVRISHAYICRYSVGSYTSFPTFVPIGGADDNALGFIRDAQDNPIPSSAYDISSVSIAEQFSPLVGVNFVLNNSMTAKTEYRKQRTMSLNINSLQLIESFSDEYVVGMGYVIKDFDVILRLKSNTQSRIKNDLTLNADISYKDVKSLLRKIDENVTQASSGNKLITIKFLADYVFSSKVNLQLYYDRQMNTPLISTSYPIASSNFGMTVKLSLTR